MTIKKEQSLKDFGFWNEAERFAAQLTDEELDNIEYELESIYPNGMNETDLNDWFWFHQDEIAEMIGTTAEKIWER